MASRPLADTPRLTVTEAAQLGVPALVRDAEHGEDVLVTRHGAPVAYVLGVERVTALRRLESALRDVALLLTRAATDTGARTSLDDALAAFGYTRAELEAENDAERSRR
jgi:prevent-host-death family protein